MNICILGAECSGKTTLINKIFINCLHKNISISLIYECVRGFVNKNQRPPLNSIEQYKLAMQHLNLVKLQNAKYKHILADTSPFLTNIYSHIYLNGKQDIKQDIKLLHLALQQQAWFDINILLTPSLPWQADNKQRDSAKIRDLVFENLKSDLLKYKVNFIEFNADDAFNYLKDLF